MTFVAVEAFIKYSCVRLFNRFYYISEPQLCVPFLDKYFTKNFLGASAAPLAKGGEGVAVAQRRRPFSRLGRPFALEVRFWSLDFLQSTCQSNRESVAWKFIRKTIKK